MSDVEMEASAIDPKSKLEDTGVDRESQSVRAGMALGLACGIFLAASNPHWWLAKVMFPLMLGGILGGWYFHLRHTPREQR